MYSLFAKKNKTKQLDQSWWVLHVYIQNVHKHIRNLLLHHFTKSGGLGP